ncbi:MAG TPA: hypothetical protein VMV29_01025 [Ktedonobacterales bacterium]|nr:hypothetical protein [Ktedonobacterales bacterium]
MNRKEFAIYRDTLQADTTDTTADDDARFEREYARQFATGLSVYEAWRRTSLIVGGADENDLYAEVDDDDDDEGEDA